MKELVYDKKGNPIYLTNERWQHIIEYHEEMIGYKDHLLLTLKKGRRRQDPIDPSIYTYYRRFGDLEVGFNHVIVIVKFGMIILDGKEAPNNFVLTAYQKFLHK